MATARDDFANNAPNDEIEEEEEEEDPEEVELCFSSSDSEPDHPALKHCTPNPPDWEPEEPPPLPTTSASEEKGDGEVDEEEATPRWPGWPGASVFRLVVGGEKVGGLIGRRGETIKRLCEVTRARVRILEPVDGVPGRIVLISATEETQAELSPAMDAAMKVFKHINEIEAINPDSILSASTPETSCARLLVPSAQAGHLIGKQGITIKSIQETTGATISITDKDEVLSSGIEDERIVEIRGASLKVPSALKSVLGLLRKFLVDHSVLHLFERKGQAVAKVPDSPQESQVTNDYAFPVNQDLLSSDCRSPLNPEGSRYLMYGRDRSLCDPYSSDISHPTDYTLPVNQDLLISDCRSPLNPKGRRYVLHGRDQPVCDSYLSDYSHPTDPLMTKITQTMHIPLLQAEDIIGVRGQNIAYIRSTSGAAVVLEETRDRPNEVLVVIDGSSSQVQTAHQLVQEILSGNRGSPPRRSYSNLDAGPRSLAARHGIQASRVILSGIREPPPRSSYDADPRRLLVAQHGIAASPHHLPAYQEHQPYSGRYGHASYR